MSVRQLDTGAYDVQLEYVRAFVLDDTPDGGVMLIDTGFERTADELVSTVKREFGGVDRLILTYEGGDHYGGLDRVMEVFEPELYVAADETDLRNAIEYDPDVLYEDGDVFDGEIEVIQMPGHTPAPSVLLLRDENALISGDVLDGADRRGLPEVYLLPPPETFNHDHAAERNLDRLLDYDFDTVFVFHGNHVTEGAKTKLEKYLNFKEHYRQSLLEE